MVALVIAFFAVQAGYHGFTASLPVALVKAGLPDAEIGLIVGVASVVQVPAAFFAGGLIDRFGRPRVLLLGCLSYLAAALLLTLPIAEPGAAGAHRSSDRDRGSAFAFFYVAMALGNAIGSIGGAAFVAAGGFAVAMTSLGVTGLGLSAILTLADGGLGSRSGVAVRPTAAAAGD